MKLPIKEASTKANLVVPDFIVAKTRMIKGKCNYKNMYKNNLNCRVCGHLEENQDHQILEKKCKIQIHSQKFLFTYKTNK